VTSLKEYPRISPFLWFNNELDIAELERAGKEEST
jgi:hypothetical protein